MPINIIDKLKINILLINDIFIHSGKITEG